MKKKILMALSYVLVIALTLTATVAYFTDTDSAVNVMTVGNIEIEQHEYQRKDGVAYNAGEAGAGNGVNEGDLVPFKQGQLLMPAYPVPGEAYPYTAEPTDLFFWGDYVFSGTAGNGLWNDNKLGNVMDKMVFVENTGKNDLYFRTVIAFECPEGMEYSEGPDKEFMMNVNGSSLYVWEDLADYITIDGVRYLVKVATYQNKLQPGNQAHPSLLQVVMTHNVEQEDAAKLGGSYEILVLSQAVQADMGIDTMDAATALNAGFGAFTAENVQKWFNDEEVKIPVLVNDAEGLAEAVENGDDVILTDDVALAQDSTMTIGSGKEIAIDLNGHTLSSVNTRTATHNFMIDVKGGTLDIKNGTVEMTHTGANMGWNGAATVIDVTAGGVLNLEGVTVKNNGGTDMNFSVHLNNWGEVTLNANNCVFDAPYCGVRVFNSGYDMNNVKITNSTLKGNNRAFWVHNYLGDLNSAQHPDDAIKARLNLDIFNNNNTYVLNDTNAVSPIRYGFGTTVYFDAAGNVVTP